MTLNLTKRPAQVGPSINTRTEKHGEEDVPGIDIPLTGIFLEAAELCAILQDQDAHDAIYTDSRGKQLEPRFQTLAPFVLDTKFTGAKVTIASTDNGSLILKPAKIGKIRLAPQVGGLTLMSCTVQGNPPEHSDVLALLNQKCRLSILNAELAPEPAEPKDPELPLDHAPQGETAGESDARDASEVDPDNWPISRTGERILEESRRTKAKRARKKAK